MEAQHFDSIYRTSQQGFTVMLTVIVVGIFGVMLSIAVLQESTIIAHTGFLLESLIRADTFAESCAEEALAHIREDRLFVGGDSISFEGGTCSYVITNGEGADERFISAEGKSSDVVRRVRVHIDRIRPTIRVVSWREVASF